MTDPSTKAIPGFESLRLGPALQTNAYPDVALILRNADREKVVGTIGGKYSRLTLIFDSVTKTNSRGGSYQCTGQARVRDNLSRFKGEFLVQGMWPVLNPGASNLYAAYLTYELVEEVQAVHAGRFTGSLLIVFEWTERGGVQWRTYDLGGKRYSNFHSVGVFTVSADGQTLPFCFGERVIPCAQDFDIGDEFFRAQPGYERAGWTD